MLRKFNSFIEKWMALVTPTCLLLGVCFPDIAKCGLPYVPAVFAFMTFAGALKSRFKDVANVFRHPGSLLIIMLLVHVVIPTAACGAGHLFFGNNMELITGMAIFIQFHAASITAFRSKYFSCCPQTVTAAFIFFRFS